VINANMAIPIASDSQPSLPPIVIDLQRHKAQPQRVQMEEDTA
jgi:hypothetical protein